MPNPNYATASETDCDRSYAFSLQSRYIFALSMYLIGLMLIMMMFGFVVAIVLLSNFDDFASYAYALQLIFMVFGGIRLLFVFDSKQFVIS